MLGSFVAETIKVYSFLVVLDFSTLEECNSAQESLYGDKFWYKGNEKCFTTYKELPVKINMPLSRPNNLGGFPFENR